MSSEYSQKTCKHVKGKALQQTKLLKGDARPLGVPPFSGDVKTAGAHIQPDAAVEPRKTSKKRSQRAISERDEATQMDYEFHEKEDIGTSAVFALREDEELEASSSKRRKVD